MLSGSICMPWSFHIGTCLCEFMYWLSFLCHILSFFICHAKIPSTLIVDNCVMWGQTNMCSFQAPFDPNDLVLCSMKFFFAFGSTWKCHCRYLGWYGRLCDCSVAELTTQRCLSCVDRVHVRFMSLTMTEFLICVGEKKQKECPTCVFLAHGRMLPSSCSVHIRRTIRNQAAILRHRNRDLQRLVSLFVRSRKYTRSNFQKPALITVPFTVMPNHRRSPPLGEIPLNPAMGAPVRKRSLVRAFHQPNRRRWFCWEHQVAGAETVQPRWDSYI